MDGGIIFFVSLLVLAIAMGFAAVVAGAFADIAEQKGHARNTYWHWVFWFAPVGIPMVLALPDLKAQKYQLRMVDQLETMNKQLEKLNQQAASQAAPSSAAASLATLELPEL